MTHHRNRMSYSVNDGPMLGSAEDYLQDRNSDDGLEIDQDYDNDFNQMLDEELAIIRKKEEAIKADEKFDRPKDNYFVGNEFWYKGKCKSKIKETKERLEDLSKLACYTCEQIKVDILRIEQDHNSTFCKMDYSPRHPPMDRPWTNSWKFNCTIKCRQAKSNHFHSSSCEEIVLEHIDPNVSPDDYPKYITEAVKLFEDFAYDTIKDMTLTDDKEATDILYQKSMWTGVKVILRNNYKNELMMIIRGKKMGPLVPKLKRYFRSGPEQNTNVISVYCISQQWSRAKHSFAEDNITGVLKLKDVIGPLKIEYKAKTSVDFNAVEAIQLAKIVEEFAGLTKETTFLDIGCGFGILSLMMARECESVIGINTMHSVNNEMNQAEEIKKYNEIENASFIACNPEDLITKCLPFIKGCSTVVALNLSTPYGKSKHVVQALRNMPSIYKVIIYGTFTKEFHRNINALIIEDHSLGDRFKPTLGCILDKSPSAENAFDIIIVFERKALIDLKTEPSESELTFNMKVEKYEYGCVNKTEDQPCSLRDGYEESKDSKEKCREELPVPPVAARRSDYVRRRDRPFLDLPPCREKERPEHMSTCRGSETERLKETFDSRFRPVSREDSFSSSRDRLSNRDRSSSTSHRDRERSSSTSHRDRSRDRSSSSSTRDKSIDRFTSRNGSANDKSSDSSRWKNGHSGSTSRREKSPSASRDRSSSTSTKEKSVDLSLIKNEMFDPNGFDIEPLPISQEKRLPSTTREKSPTSKSHKKSSHSSKENTFTAPAISVKKEFKFKYRTPPREISSPMSPPQPVPPPAEYPTLTRSIKVEPIKSHTCEEETKGPRTPPHPPPAEYPTLTKSIKDEPIQSCNREEDSERVLSPPRPVPPPFDVLLTTAVKTEPTELCKREDSQIFKAPLIAEPAQCAETSCNISQPITAKIELADSPMSPMKQETPPNLQGIEYMETPIHRPRAFNADSPLSPPQIAIPTSFGIDVQSNLSYLPFSGSNPVETLQIKKEKDADSSPAANVAKDPDEIPIVKIKSEVIDPDYGESLPEVSCENIPLPVKVKSEPIDYEDILTQPVRIKNEPEDMDISPQDTPKMESIQTPIHTPKAFSDTPRPPSSSSYTSSSIVDDSEFSVNTNSSYLPIKLEPEQSKASVNVKEEPGEISNSSSSSEEIRIVGEKKKKRSSPPKIRVKTVDEIIKVKTEIKEADDLKTLYEQRQAILRQLGAEEEVLPQAYKRQISSPSPPRKYKSLTSPAPKRYKQSSSSSPRKYSRSPSPSPRIKYSRSPSPFYSSKRRRRSPSFKRPRRSPSSSERRRKRSPLSPDRIKKEPLSPLNHRRKERSKRSPSFNKREIYGRLKSPENSRCDRRRNRSRSPRRW